jgi:hypothetical protein
MKETSTTNEQSFNKKFCNHLEYHLGATFEKSKREDLNGFWCDGVSWFSLDEKQLTKKSVNDKRKIVTKAWIGKTGQTEYEMTIHFGKHSLRRYAKGTSLCDCLPSNESMDWINIDTKKQTIEIWLK